MTDVPSGNPADFSPVPGLTSDPDIKIEDIDFDVVRLSLDIYFVLCNTCAL